MRLNELRPARGAKKRRKRVGCGTGSGRGTTSGRGNKGQDSRSGGGTPPWFEGGQMPIYRRLPARGFKNRFRTVYQVVNVEDLSRFDAGATIGPPELLAARLVRRKDRPVKLLGQGELAHALTVQVHAASRSAVEKIGQGGGQVVILQVEGGKADGAQGSVPPQGPATSEEETVTPSSGTESATASEAEAVPESAPDEKSEEGSSEA
jgi:large subunit ribosomal protein L15